MLGNSAGSVRHAHSSLPCSLVTRSTSSSTRGHPATPGHGRVGTDRAVPASSADVGIGDADPAILRAASARGSNSRSPRARPRPPRDRRRRAPTRRDRRRSRSARCSYRSRSWRPSWRCDRGHDPGLRARARIVGDPRVPRAARLVVAQVEDAVVQPARRRSEPTRGSAADRAKSRDRVNSWPNECGAGGAAAERGGGARRGRARSRRGPGRSSSMRAGSSHGPSRCRCRSRSCTCLSVHAGRGAVAGRHRQAGAGTATAAGTGATPPRSWA